MLQTAACGNSVTWRAKMVDNFYLHHTTQ